MRRILLFFLFGGGTLQAQFCPFLGPDQFLPCGVTTATLTADFSQCPQGSGPKETSTYLVQNIPYAAQTNTGTLVTLSDDSQSATFNIGFTFCYYGQSYTQFRIGSNGWVSLGAGAQPATFTSATIPNAGATVPKNCIMGPWQDWHPGIGGQVRYQLQGVAPCRKLVVSWINVPMFSCTNLQGTFHIVLYESTNVIENHIQNKPNCPGWAGGTAVQGVHNAAGSAAVTVPGRNSTQWTTNNNAYRYTPNGPNVIGVPTWFQVGNPVAIGTGTTITVTPPPTGANYICVPLYPSCFAGWSNCNNQAGGIQDTVFVQPGPASLPTPIVTSVDPICNNDCDGAINVTPVGGTGAVTINWGAQGTAFNISNLCPGPYTFNLSDAAGCTYDSTIIINNPPPLQQPTIAGTDPTCFGFCDGDATVTPTDGIAPYTFQWSNGQTSQTVTALCDGTYDVTVFDDNNCPAQASITLTEPPEVTLNAIQGLDTICFNSTNNTYTVSSTFPNLTYTWTASPGSISSGQGTGSINFDASGVNGGLYPSALTVIGEDASGCLSQPESFDVVVLQILPVINPEPALCEYNSCVQLSANPAGGVFSGNGVINGQFCPDSTLVGSNAINYLYTQSNCEFETNDAITVYPRPVIDYIYNNVGAVNSQFNEVCEGEDLTSTYNAMTTGGQVTWFFLGDSIQSQELELTWTSDVGIYLIYATVTENGCVSYPVDYDVTIQDCPEELIFIPNTFTPDDNEINQVWYPIFTDGFDPYDYQMVLYNRWGEVIWESQDATAGWDGTYGGRKCEQGVYTWKVTYGDPDNGKKKVRHGNLNLIR